MQIRMVHRDDPPHSHDGAVRQDQTVANVQSGYTGTHAPQSFDALYIMQQRADAAAVQQ